jgi:ribosome modulation factor
MSLSNQCFNEGRNDYFNGKGKHENPYEQYSEEYNQWLKGFKCGQKEDLEQDPDGN